MATDAAPAEVRRAKPSEAAELTAIAFEAKRHWGYPDDWVQGWASQLRLTPEYVATHDVYVVEIDNAIAGVVALRPLDAPHAVEIDHLWVRPTSMRAGIGWRLLRHAAKCAVARGATTLKIVSDPNAESFYARAGAQRVGTTPSTPVGRHLPVLELDLGSRSSRRL